MKCLHFYLVELEIARLYLDLELAYFYFSVKDTSSLSVCRIASQFVNEDIYFTLKVKWPKYLTVATNTSQPMFICYIVFKTFQYIAV